MDSLVQDFIDKDNFTFRNLTLKLRQILGQSLKINEALGWQNFCIYKGIKENKTPIDYQSLHIACTNYISKLEYYENNHMYYEDNTLQDKFFNQELTEIRKIAVNAINTLQLKVNSTNDIAERTNIQGLINDIRLVTNTYLATVRDILQHDRKLQTILLSHNINFIDKYQLQDI